MTKIKQFSVLQSFAILLIVLSHVFPKGITYPSFFLWFYHYLMSFNVPLFMVIAGFLFYYSGGVKFSYFDFLRKKAHRLLLPYIFISSIAFIPKALLSNYAIRSTELSFTAFIKNIIYPTDNVVILLWFLPTLFIIFVIVPSFIRTQDNSRARLIIITITLTLLHFFNPFLQIKLFNLAGVANYLIFFWVGCLAACYKHLIEKYLTNNLTFIALVFITIVLNLFGQTSHSLNFITALAGTIMAFSFCQIYIINNWYFLNFMEGYSFQIYLLSWFPQTAIVIIVYKILGLGFYLNAILMFLGGLLIPLVVAKYVQARNLRYKSVIGL